MPASQPLSDSTSQSLQQDPLRQRVSGAFEKLVASAAELNAVSDEIAKPISAIEATLQKLNLGVSAWTQFELIRDDYDLYHETRYIGYTKVSQRWGLAIRRTMGIDGEPEGSEEWHFNDAPRAYRLEALEKLPELLEKLAETSGKTAAKLRKGITLTKQVAETISQMAPSKPARRK